jgi:hypothetical protein
MKTHSHTPILVAALLVASFALAQTPAKLVAAALERSVPYSLAKSEFKTASEKPIRWRSNQKCSRRRSVSIPPA